MLLLLLLRYDYCYCVIIALLLSHFGVVAPLVFFYYYLCARALTHTHTRTTRTFAQRAHSHSLALTRTHSPRLTHSVPLFGADDGSTGIVPLVNPHNHPEGAYYTHARHARTGALAHSRKHARTHVRTHRGVAARSLHRVQRRRLEPRRRSGGPLVGGRPAAPEKRGGVAAEAAAHGPAHEEVEARPVPLHGAVRVRGDVAAGCMMPRRMRGRTVGCCCCCCCCCC